MDQLSDEQLFKLFQNGDNKPFDYLMVKYQNKLVTFIYMIVGDQNLAEDLAQDTFVKVITKKHTYNEKVGAKFSTWMYTIAKNLAFSELRKKTRRKTDSFSDIKRGGEDQAGRPIEIADFSQNPEDQIMASFKKVEIFNGLSLLSEEFKLIIILRDIQELSYDRISTILEVPIGTVKSRINRARDKLLLILKEKGTVWMNINDFDKYISGYLDGELRESDVEEFEQLLDKNPDCREKLKDYKKMLDMLSSIEVKASNDFIDKVYEKVNLQSIIQPNIPKTIFGYNYITLSGMVAALGIFVFSISTFMSSDSMPLFNMNQLSAKNVEQKADNSSSSMNLIAEDDTTNETDDIDLPKIHLVGGKK